MKPGGAVGSWVAAYRRWRSAPGEGPAVPVQKFIPPRIGLALGGGFARGIAHVGVLRVFERYQIPIDYIAGVSAGAIVAAAFASGTTPDEIAHIGCSMRFADVARWSICRMGFAGSERMSKFLRKLLKATRFEDMRTPLGVVATDLVSGEPVLFQHSGDVIVPIRASCSYPGLFHPVPYEDRLLVDGAMSMEVPSSQLRALGATRVISVHLPMQGPTLKPSNMFQVVNRCFQIMQTRTESAWRADSDLVLVPDVRGMQWDAFESARQLVEAGERAALEALPAIQGWLKPAAEVLTLERPLNGNGKPHNNEKELLSA